MPTPNSGRGTRRRPALFVLARAARLPTLLLPLISSAAVGQPDASGAEQGSAAGVVERLSEILSSLAEQPGGNQIQPWAQRVAALGPSSLPVLVRMRIDGEWPEQARGTLAEVRLDARARKVLTASLGILRDPYLLDYLSAHLNAGIDPREGQRTLILLGELASSRDLTKLHVFALALDPSRPRIRDGFEQALRATLQREEGAFSALSFLWGDLHPDLLLPALRSVGASQRRAGLGLLLRLLDRPRPGAQQVLRAIEALTSQLDCPRTQAPLDGLRVLLREDDPDLQAIAATCLGRLGDSDSVPDLIDLLDPVSGAAPELRRSIAASLTLMTGLALGPQVERWREVQAREDRWWREERPALAATLESGEAREVGRVLHDYLAHEFYRDDLARDLEAALAHPDEQVRVLTCRALGQLGAPNAWLALVEQLEDASPLVRSAALQALTASTELVLPGDPDRWRLQLGLDSDFE